MENKKEYKIYIKLVLDALLKVDSRLKLNKCKFRIKEIVFLGYIIYLE